jgi:hypothetical protein
VFHGIQYCCAKLVLLGVLVLVLLGVLYSCAILALGSLLLSYI